MTNAKSAWVRVRVALRRSVFAEYARWSWDVWQSVLCRLASWHD